MIVIEKSQNIADAELLLRRLAASKTARNILLPRKLHNWQIGGKASLIQFLITWSKKFPNNTLYTHVQNPASAESQLVDFCNQDHGLVAVLVSSNILNLKGNTSLKSFAYQAARSRVEAMHLGPMASQRGSKIFLMCADMTTKAALPSLYYLQRQAPTCVSFYIQYLLTLIVKPVRVRMSSYLQSLQKNFV